MTQSITTTWTDQNESLLTSWTVSHGTYLREIKKKDKSSKEVSEDKTYHLVLKECNKSWDRPYNWEVSISLGDKLLHIERFYLNVKQWSLAAAQQQVSKIMETIG